MAAKYINKRSIVKKTVSLCYKKLITGTFKKDLVGTGAHVSACCRISRDREVKSFTICSRVARSCDRTRTYSLDGIVSSRETKSSR